MLTSSQALDHYRQGTRGCQALLSAFRLRFSLYRALTVMEEDTCLYILYTYRPGFVWAKSVVYCFRERSRVY
jgi:hypothetical protein